jgi:hypothetical protein
MTEKTEKAVDGDANVPSTGNLSDLRPGTAERNPVAEPVHLRIM